MRSCAHIGSSITTRRTAGTGLGTQGSRLFTRVSSLGNNRRTLRRHTHGRLDVAEPNRAFCHLIPSTSGHTRSTKRGGQWVDPKVGVTAARLSIYTIIPTTKFNHQVRARYPGRCLSVNGRAVLRRSIRTLLTRPQIGHIIVTVDPNSDHFTRLPLTGRPRVAIMSNNSRHTSSILTNLGTTNSTR